MFEKMDSENLVFFSYFLSGVGDTPTSEINFFRLIIPWDNQNLLSW